MKRKILAVLLTITMVVTLTPAISFADTAPEDAADEVTVIQSGSCGMSGSNVSYELTSDGTLTITGDGKITCSYREDGWYHDWGKRYYTPWNDCISSIKKVVISKGITSIGTEAFCRCYNLEECVYLGSLEEWCKIRFGSRTSNPCSQEAALIIDNKVVKDLVIPDSITSIGNYAFSGCSSITSITIPNSVTEIGENAFSGLKITGITIPGNVKTIGQFAFYNCTDLKNVTVSDGVTKIDYGAFKTCTGLKNVCIPGSVGSIDQQAFFNCSSLKNVYIPTSVGFIGDNAFYGCNNCTAWCAKSGGGYSINCNSVYDASSTEYNFYAALTGEESDIEIPEGVTVIPVSAFMNYSSLKSVTIPGSVTTIGSAAFNGCSNLNYVLYGGNSKNNLNIANGNDALNGATWYNNYSKTALDTAKASAKADLSSYKNPADYREAQKAELQTAITTESGKLDAVIAADLLPAALASAKAELDKIKTNAQLTQEELAAAKTSAKTELASYKNPDDYRTAEKTTLTNAIASGDNAIDAAENIDAVNTALANAKSAIDLIKTNAQLTQEELAAAKTSAKTELASYKNPDDYRTAEKTTLTNAIASGDNAIDAAENIDAVNTALANAKSAIDLIKTNAQLTQEELAAAKVSAKAELASYKNPDNYRTAEKVKLSNAITAGNNAIDAAENIDAVNTALANAKAELNKIRTSAYYLIYSANLSTVMYTYDGEAKTPQVTVKNGEGIVLNAGTDYIVEYPSERTNAGTYTVKITGAGGYSGTLTANYTIKAQDVKRSNVLLSSYSYIYNGKAKAPAVQVKNEKGTTLEPGSDYIVAYASGRTRVGTYKVKVTAKGNYSGVIDRTFKINPKSTTLYRPVKAKKAFTVKWKKQSVQTTGYQIRYSLKSSMSSAKTVTVTKNSTTSRKISHLKSKKKYYVQIRTYKTVDGKKYYSSWSTGRSVTTK